MIIIKSTWFGSTPEGRAIGCVLTIDENTNEVRGYMGVGHDVGISSCENGRWMTEEDNDALKITEMGQRVSKEMLESLFGDIDRYTT